MDAFQILVIILSSVLGVFLVLAIIAVIFILKLIKELRAIAEKGNAIALKAESLTTTLVDSVSTSHFLKAVTGLVSAVRKFK